MSVGVQRTIGPSKGIGLLAPPLTCLWLTSLTISSPSNLGPHLAAKFSTHIIMVAIVFASHRVLDVVATLGPLSDFYVPRGAYDSDLPRDLWFLLLL